MPSFPLLQVDAFTDRPLSGNPCAVVLDADELDDTTMLAIAREMNLSETAFVRTSAVADVGARFFTPTEEIPLAGHPTIATIFALAESGRLAIDGDTTISLELAVGPIRVDIRASGNKVREIVMSQKKPEFFPACDPDEILPLFGLTADDALPNAPIQVVSTGTPMLMIPVCDLGVLRRAHPDMARYRAVRLRLNFFSPHLFCVTGPGRTFARHFGTPGGVAEDPFTGSATGAMAAYLWHHGLIAQSRLVAEQGDWLGRPGRANVEVVGPAHDIETVRVAGAAVTVLRGELHI